MGASAEEGHEVRDADRRAEGISAEIEAECRCVVADATKQGPLLVIETTAPTASAVHDFLLTEYGGPDPTDVLVATVANWSFSGDGRVISDLSTIPGCWYGGDLPARGFWGAPRNAIGREALIARILEALRPASPTDVPSR